MAQDDRTRFNSETYLEGNPFTLLGQVQNAANPNIGGNWMENREIDMSNASLTWEDHHLRGLQPSSAAQSDWNSIFHELGRDYNKLSNYPGGIAQDDAVDDLEDKELGRSLHNQSDPTSNYYEGEMASCMKSLLRLSLRIDRIGRSMITNSSVMVQVNSLVQLSESLTTILHTLCANQRHNAPGDCTNENTASHASLGGIQYSQSSSKSAVILMVLASYTQVLLIFTNVVECLEQCQMPLGSAANLEQPCQPSVAVPTLVNPLSRSELEILLYTQLLTHVLNRVNQSIQGFLASFAESLNHHLAKGLGTEPSRFTARTHLPVPEHQENVLGEPVRLVLIDLTSRERHLAQVLARLRGTTSITSHSSRLM